MYYQLRKLRHQNFEQHCLTLAPYIKIYSVNVKIKVLVKAIGINCFSCCTFKLKTFKLYNGGIAVRRGFSLIGSCVEDLISEITMFIFLLHIPVVRWLNHNRTET